MTEDFYSARQWHSTGLYTDYLGSGGIEKSLIMPLPGPPGIARRADLHAPARPRLSRQAPLGGRRCCSRISPTRCARDARLRATRVPDGARQQELLQLVAAGHHNPAIARQLELSTRHRPHSTWRTVRQVSASPAEPRQSPNPP